MKYMYDSPLIRTLFIVFIFTCALMLAPMFWPLPQVSAIDSNDVSAADIAEYLGEGTISAKQAFERPLFHKNRRPSIEKAEVIRTEPVVVEDVFSLELVGVMGANADSRTAYLLDTNTQETHAVKRDQIVDGWSIVAVEVNSVILANDAEQKTLSLK